MPIGVYLAGLGIGISLIAAIGAQNAFVLRQGVRRERVLLVVAICAVSDIVLVVGGAAGMGAALDAVPWLVQLVRWLGAAFLIGYGVIAARRAIRGGDGLDPGVARPGASARSVTIRVALTTLALTWLNPHVYLDTVVLLGSVAATHGDARWWFALGATVASLVWFTALGLGARWLGRFLRTARAWRVLDGVVAVIMVALAVSLLAA